MNTKGLITQESYETVAALYNTEGRLIREDYLTNTDLTALIKVIVVNADKTKFWWPRRAGWPYLREHDARIARYDQDSHV